MDIKKYTSFFIFFLFFLLISISGSVFSQEEPPINIITDEFTPTTETHCETVNGRKTCDLTLYSGIKFVFEDNKWKDLQDARSLKDYYNVVYLEKDNEHDIELIDFNYTNIELRVFVKDSKELNKDIPFKVDGIEETTKRLTSLGDKAVVIFTSNHILASNYSFGSKSTTIQLQDADSENLDDTYVREGLPDYTLGTQTTITTKAEDNNDWRIYIKFNISSIPTGQQIDNASLTLFKHGSGEAAGDRNISAYHSYNSSWTEGTVVADNQIWNNITWNNQPCGILFDNSVECNLTAEDTNVIPNDVGVYYTWNVGVMIKTEYDDGNNNVSIIVKDDQEQDTQYGRGFRSKEYSTVSERPYLNITYSEAAGDSIPPALFIDFPTNTTLTELNPDFNFTVEGGDNDAIWYSLNDTTNVTITGNITLSIGDGTYTIKLFANDTSGNENQTSQSFSIVISDTTFPILFIDHPTNITLDFADPDFNWTYEGGDNDTIWYSLNDTINITITGNITLTIGIGTYTLKLFANDTSSNENQTSVAFSIVSPPPRNYAVFENEGGINVSKGVIVIQNSSSTYSNGEAYLCIYDNGTLFAKDSACS